MKFYNNDGGTYEELAAQYPAFYREVYEMQEILKAQGKLADDVMSGIERVFGDQFIDGMDSEVTSEFEKLLGISYAKGTLEERRAAVKAHMIGTGKISASAIRRMIKAYSGEEAVCEFKPCDDEGNNALRITAERKSGGKFDFAGIYKMLSSKLPAHISFDLDIGCGCGIEIFCEREIFSNSLPDCGIYCCGQNGGYLCF